MLFRSLAVVVLIVGLVAVAVLGPRWLMSVGQEDAMNNPGKASGNDCQLLAGSCDWSHDGQRWQVTLSRLQTDGEGDQLELRVATSADPRRLVAVLRGESMYLGEYPVPLRLVSPGQGENEAQPEWVARFTAPYCTVEPDMTWRIDLQQGQEMLQGMPGKLLFEASAAK